MVLLALYPIVRTNTCTHWHDADTADTDCHNVLDKASDGDCVHHHVHITGNHDLELLNYLDSAGAAPAIPADATINDVVMWIHGAKPADAFMDLQYLLTIGINTYGFSAGLPAGVPFACADCIDAHFHFGAILTVAQINGEIVGGVGGQTYTTKLRAVYGDGHGATVNVEADLVWLEITYTEAATTDSRYGFIM